MSENKTFCFGENIPMNACVGNNGFTDIGTYKQGYLIAVEKMYESIKEENSVIDLLIYPMIFSARHYTELFLKEQLNQLITINSNKSRIVSDEIKRAIYTHDISNLYNFVEQLSGVDIRYEAFIDPIKEYIDDFYDIDSTGEIFRYPYDRNHDKHLEDVSHINVDIFYKRFCEMIEHFEKIETVTYYLDEEYQQKTVIGDLSRSQIEEISKKLPNKETWNEPSFCKIKESLKQEYSISGNQLSNVIKLIQSHLEFSINIGIENTLKELNIENLERYFELYLGFQNEYEIGNYLDVKNDYCEKIHKKVSFDSLFSIATLVDISSFSIYSEEYEFIFKNKSKETDVYSFIFRELLDRVTIPELLQLGLFKTGQTTLYKFLFNYFDTRDLVEKYHLFIIE